MSLVGLAIWASIFATPSPAQTNTDRNAAGVLESPIGKVMTVAGIATVEHDTVVVVQAKLTSGPNPAKVGDFVYQGDVVQTGSDGKLGITFMDGTSFNLSSNARMVLNEFVYDPKGKSNSTLFSLTKGSFTFIAGAIAKSGDMKLDTPVATMGIRGTTPHVEIRDDGTVSFATLIEENKAAQRSPPQRSGDQDIQRTPPAQQRASTRSSAPELSAGEAARYNKLFNMDFRICRGC
jgi:hypothetical protein